MLLPGIEGDARAFARQLPLCKERTVLALDLPRGMDRLDAMAARTLAMLDLMGAPKRFALVGLSLGGLIGRAVVAQSPDRVAALVTLGSLPSPLVIPESVRRGRLGGAVMPGMMFDMLYGVRFRRHLAEEGVDPLLIEQLVADLPDKTEVMRRLDAVLSWGLPDEIVAPTLYLLGQVDAEAPWTLADVMRLLPGVTVGVVPGGHRAPLTHPQAFHTAILTFLEGRR